MEIIMEAIRKDIVQKIMEKRGMKYDKIVSLM